MAQEPGTPGPGPRTPAGRPPAAPAPAAHEPAGQAPAAHAPVGPAPAEPAPGRVEISDLAALTALAHPRRQRMFEHLSLYGPATSATLARALGLNTGSTSYHLRELARYGFVEETARTPKTQGAVGGRERWWRAVPGDRRFPPRSRQSPEMRLVLDELDHRAHAADVRLYEQVRQDTPDDDPWSDAFPHSRGSIRLTLPELSAFFEEYIALINRYKRPAADTPPGARTVLTRFLAFPAPAVDGHGPRDEHADRTDHGDPAGPDVLPAQTTNPSNPKGTEPS
ncbi:winged helix-turn-helix domain-containing protein [Streptomyces mangrovisoli]|uniref:winged helix-turn-helix domain-containing protein n=1 Tax=Streptomyces mangrovisoli TaxID=1428628 RepID=UPI0009A0C6B2|nr:helix-turn-helix domain-containing protein [Streptomyces mangrovisoli]